jgi:hypothetical protein
LRQRRSSHGTLVSNSIPGRERPDEIVVIGGAEKPEDPRANIAAMAAMAFVLADMPETLAAGGAGTR